MKLETNPQLSLAREFVRNTNTHLFLTGKAGTGKTTFLRQLKEITFKRFVVLAPTGVAAMNAGGVTIHSFFQLPFGPQVPGSLEHLYKKEAENPSTAAARYQRFNREKINIIRSLDLLVIDEISMVRADLLDAIDAVLRRYKNRYKPFGGLQLLMIGDLHQLAPIAKEEEWELLRHHYDSVFFFSSKALSETKYISIELNQVFRQSDPYFIQLLNKIRGSQPDQQTIDELNQRYLPEIFNTDPEGYITLTTHNYQAQTLNDEKLLELPGKKHSFQATIKNEFPEYLFPTEATLVLKKGAQVMFVKNDPNPAKQFFNGKIGKLIDINTEDDVLTVKCPDDEDPIFVNRLEWQNNRYSLNEETKEIEESIIGTFTQYPLKLAWAITIHKSQGLTFDKAIIDAKSAFAHGQVYVALSRCRSFQGMVFRSLIPASAIKSNSRIDGYMKMVEENLPDQNDLQIAKNSFQQLLVKELFDFEDLRRRLRYLVKIAHENSQSLDKTLLEKYDQTEKQLTNELIEVSKKFHNQIQQLANQQPDVESNAMLQERIKKASEFFAPKHLNIINQLESAIETDNKTVKKSLQEALNRLLNEAEVQQACLTASKNGFTISEYLSVRAKAAASGSEHKLKSTAKKRPAETKKGRLLQLLKTWRDTTAETETMEVYEVLPIRSMKEIAEKIPSNMKELLKIHGLGRIRVNRFGSEILSIIQAYAEDENIDITLDDSPLEEPEPKVKKVASEIISFEMFKSGKKIEEIARERGFANSTIEGHLAKYVGKGELKPEEIISPEKAEIITEYFLETQDPMMVEAKNVLGEEYSYGEIKIVLSHLRYTKQIENNEPEQ